MVKEIQSKVWPLIVLLAFSLLVACSGLEPAEYETIDQELFVKEYGTGIPIENATITLYQNRTPKYDGYPHGLLVDFATHQTDANGRVHLKGKMQKITIMAASVPSTKPYFFDVVYGSGWGSNDHNSFATLSADFIANPVFELYPHAWLKLSVDLLQLEGGYDEVRYRSDRRFNGTIKQSGTTAPILAKGNVLHRITFEGFKEGEFVKSWVQELYLPGRDTQTYQIDAYLTPGR